MINPLQIPEIIGKVVEHLDTRDLAVVSFVNKTWRLEAQRKLYQNRRTIIYGFFKPYLNDLKNKRYDLTRGLLAIIPFQKFKELEAFRRAFDLDLKKELRELRRQLRKKHNRAERICEKLDEERVEKSGLPWASYREVKRKFDKAKDQQHELYRELINFEYFLVRFGYFSVLDQEIDVIIDKVQDLDEWEEERKWEAIADTIFEYWDDEDPDTVFE